MLGVGESASNNSVEESSGVLPIRFPNFNLPSASSVVRILLALGSQNHRNL